MAPLPPRRPSSSQGRVRPLRRAALVLLAAALALTAASVARRAVASPSGSGAVAASPRPAAGKVAWSTGYWMKGMQPIPTIAWRAYTHIAHMALCANPDGSVRALDLATSDAIVQAAHAHGRKVLLNVGADCGDSSPAFARLSTDTRRRRAFVSNAIKHLKAHDYDGLDINWEGDLTPQFATLFAELRAALDAAGRGKLLAAPIHNNHLREAASIAAHVDQLNVMSYYWSPSDRFWSRYYAEVAGAGIPKSKVGVGFGTDAADCVHVDAVTCKPEVTDAAAQEAKARWAIENGYRGFMVWRLADANRTLEPILEQYVP